MTIFINQLTLARKKCCAIQAIKVAVLILSTLFFITLSAQTLAQPVNARDPTRPSTTAPLEKEAGEKKGTYELQSIILGKRRQLALINGKFVSVGDNIGGARVIAIEKNSVTLSESGQKITIILFEGGIWN